MKTVPLADVLWDAANRHLSPYGLPDDDGYSYSCEAVADALDKSGRFFDKGWLLFQEHHASMFLASLGCIVSSSSHLLEFDHGEPRQGVRYMWLLLAMHVAEDEGIMIEVND